MPDKPKPSNSQNLSSAALALEKLQRKLARCLHILLNPTELRWQLSFLSSFYTKTIDAVKTDRYTLSSSSKYEMYWKRLKDDPDLQLVQSTFLKLTNINDLVDQGFLVASKHYTEWVDAHAHETINHLTEILKAN